jgi:DNA-binding MarR family transcriptional regulator
MSDKADPFGTVEEFLYKTSSLIANRLKKKGLTFMQLCYLRTIDSQGQTTVSRLAKTLSLTKPSVSVLIKHLEEGGFVERIKSAKDKRSSSILLTGKGKEICDDWRRIQAKYLQQFHSHLDEEEAETFRSLLLKIMDAGTA